MADLLIIDAATKTFAAPEGGEVRALDRVSMAVSANEFVTLLGPSGCGKTTLLRAISGFEPLDSGEIYIDGQPMGTRPAHLRPVHTVFQRYALFPHLTVARNVAYSLEVRRADKAEIARRVDEMLALVGLGGLGGRRIDQLSGGQQQRVALARSLVARPKILLLDEPLSALDKALRHRMQHELKTLQHELGISFVFVTHDQEEALVMSDRIAVLDGGRIQQIDVPEALYYRPRNEFVARFIGDSNLLGGTVTAVADGRTTVALDGLGEATVGAIAGRTGQRVQVLVRPEALHLEAGQTGGGQMLRGTIRQSHFVGTDYQLLVGVDGLAPLKVTLRGQEARTCHGTNDPIRLFLADDALHVIPDTGGPDAPAAC